MTKYVIDLKAGPNALATYVDNVNRRDAEMRRIYGGNGTLGAFDARRLLAEALRHAQQAATEEAIEDLGKAADWADQLAAANAEAASLRVANANLLEANQKLQEAWTVESRRADDLSEKLGQAKDDYNAAASDREDLEVKLEQERELSSAASHELRITRRANRALNTENAELTSELRDANARANRLQDVNDKLRRHLTTMTGMLRSIKSDTTTQVLTADQLLADLDANSTEAPK